MFSIDLKQIKYTKKSNYYCIEYENKPLIIDVKDVFIPFGVEKNYSNYIIKIAENDKSSELFEFIHQLEKNNIDYLHSIENTFKEEDYKSQILKRPNYPNSLIIKIPIVKNQIQTDIKCSNENIISLFDIPKKSTISLQIEIDKLWFFKSKYSCIPKTKIMRLMNT